MTSQINMPLLMLCVMSLLFPTCLVSSSQVSLRGDLGMSRCASVIMILLYCCYLYFQLFSHRALFDEGGDHAGHDNLPIANGTANLDGEGASLLASHTVAGTESPAGANHSPVTPAASGTAPATGGATTISPPSEDDEDEEEEDVLGFHWALFWLACITVLISYLSDILVATIHAAAKSAHVSALFLSAIVIPIIGNAAEHAGAIMFASKNKVDLSLAIAVGSSTQIAVMVLPLLVIISWCGNLQLTLDFQPYESITLFLTVVTVTFVIMDGNSTWLMGAALIGAYIVVAAGFWVHTAEDLNQ